MYDNYIVFVDDEDYDSLCRRKWRRLKGPYSRRVYAYNKRLGLMHRIIAKAPEGYDVHHIDGNGLNNTRSNLIVLSRSDHLRTRHGESRLTQ